MEKLVINGQTFEYILKRSSRKSISIEIGYDGSMVVRVPQRVSMRKVEELLETKSKWIYENVSKRKMESVREEDQVFYLGKRLTLKVEEQTSNLLGIQVKGNELIIKKPAGYQLQLPVVLEQWYRKMASMLIRQKVQEYSRLMQVTYQVITIRDQKTRWGSCSNKGNLNFNYRLVMAPEEVLDYVIVHELAHRIHMDHSKAFWEEVSKVMPEYKERRNWLKEHGHELKL